MWALACWNQKGLSPNCWHNFGCTLLSYISLCAVTLRFNLIELKWPSPNHERSSNVPTYFWPIAYLSISLPTSVSSQQSWLTSTLCLICNTSLKPPCCQYHFWKNKMYGHEWNSWCNTNTHIKNSQISICKTRTWCIQSLNPLWHCTTGEQNSCPTSN